MEAIEKLILAIGAARVAAKLLPNDEMDGALHIMDRILAAATLHAKDDAERDAS